MTDEVSEETYWQIVFLIDSNPLFWGSSHSAVDAANAVRLCVLKVLTYFCDFGRGKRLNLRWGYKFFSSRSLSHHFERHEFKELSVNVFEEFENQVWKKLNESFTQQFQESVLEQSAQGVDEFPRLAKQPAGAKCISCAFTNAVHDFQWDRPDISSPVKRTRGNRTKIRNVMFLLSGCPFDDASISDFRGEISSSLTSLESLKNVLMPSVLYKEFKERHICLQWVNIGNVQLEKNLSLKSLLEAFVEQLGGCLIPLSSFGYRSDCQDLSSCKEDKSSFNGPLLPFKTVMDFYLAGKTIKLSEVAANIAQCFDMKLAGCSETRGLLCSSGTDDKVHCSVRLSSVFHPATRQQSQRNIGQVTTEAEDLPTQVSTEMSGCCPALLWIRGVINQSCVCPTWLHPMKTYSCIGLDCTQTHDSTNTAVWSKELLSGWFQELLLSLAKDSKLLVLDFIDCSSGLPVSGVLQPLTSVCGVISVISSEFLVTFEKLLLWNDKMVLVDRRKVQSGETSKTLVSELKSRPVCKSAGRPAHSEVFLRLRGSQNNLQELTTSETREFEAGFLDPWFPVAGVGDKDGLPWRELKSGNESEEEGDKSGEAALMKELKVLYNRKETKPKSTILKGRQSPRYSKHKIGTPKKSKGKGKKDSLKQSSNVAKETEKDDRGSKFEQSENQPDFETNTINNSSATEDSQTTANSDRTQEDPCQIKDEVQLKKAIHSIRDKVIFEGEDILKEVTNIVMSVSRFYQMDGHDRQTDCVVKYLKENALLTTSTLREKYEGCDAALRKEQQVREYQLQILLRTEIAVLTNADENSALVEEVTVLLRAISFVKDPTFLTVYLREVLLGRYSRSLPKFLCGVYEGLMMRPPKEVLTPSKWSSDDESPVRRSVNSVSSVKQDSSQPRSSGCRVLTRHMSITEAAGKRREIVVPGRAKPKEKDKKKMDKPQGPISARDVNKKDGKNARGLKTPVKLVRRNLFTESGGADENDSTPREPRKRKLSEGGLKKDERRRRFHRRNTVGSFAKNDVQETPAHKQVSHALWCKQDRARKRSRACTEVHVLQESPLKEIQAGESLPRRSPRRHPPGVIFQRSQSFYGRSASAGPLTRTRSFTGVRPRESPKKEPTEASENSVEKTPQKLTFAAVSPLRFSPRHKKKFSLHSLLATAKHCNQKEEGLARHPKPTTPTRQHMATRSSPRLLKKRSFSCIGFSTVPFPGIQKTEPIHINPEPGPFENMSFRSPGKEGVCSDTGLPESCVKTPNKDSADGQVSEAGMITPKTKRTPLKDYQMDDCVVLLTPIRNPLKSPVHISPKVMADPSPSSKDHTQSPVIESSKNLDRSSQALHENVSPPEKSVINSAVRSSPRFLRKRELSKHSKETSGELCKSIDRNMMKIKNPSCDMPPSSTRDDLAEPITPIKDHDQDECVVLLTPIRGPLTSPVHVRSQDINAIVSGEDATADGPSKLAVNSERFPVTSPAFKSLRSSPRFSMSSSLDTMKGSAQGSSGAEQNHKRLSVKSKTKSPMINESRCISSAGEGTPWSSDGICLADGSTQGPNIASSPRAAPRGLSPAPQFKSPRPSRASPVAAVHVLRNQSPQNSTPPPKKGKKKSHGVSSSPAETKRLSPLNQILRQQKRKRFFSISPAGKCSREAAPSKEARKKKSAERQDAEEGGLLNVSCPIAIEDNNARSSEDLDDWLTEMQKEFEQSVADERKAGKSPPKKKRRIHKSVVFGGKRALKNKKLKKENTNSSLSSDTSFEEDDEVFQSPAVTASTLRRRHVNKTPLSASSIRILQESPILCGSKPTLSPPTRRYSGRSPNSEDHNRKGKLSRRKFMDISSHNEASVSDAFVDDQEEPIGFSLRKRLKLNT